MCQVRAHFGFQAWLLYANSGLSGLNPDQEATLAWKEGLCLPALSQSHLWDAKEALKEYTNYGSEPQRRAQDNLQDLLLHGRQIILQYSPDMQDIKESFRGESDDGSAIRRHSQQVALWSMSAAARIVSQ